MSCLVVVDMQTGFCDPRGELSLATLPHNPREVVQDCFDNVKRLLSEVPFGLVVWTLDKHPADHVSFITSKSTHAKLEAQRISGDRIQYNYKGASITQQLYKSHCIDGTDGQKVTKELTDFAPPWDTPSGELVVPTNGAAEAQTYFRKGDICSTYHQLKFRADNAFTQTGPFTTFKRVLKLNLSY
eukprot:g32842.t1